MEIVFKRKSWQDQMSKEHGARRGGSAREVHALKIIISKKVGAQNFEPLLFFITDIDQCITMIALVILSFTDRI